MAKRQGTKDTYLKLCGQVTVIENILNERQLNNPVTTVTQDQILITELNNFIASEYTTSWQYITSNDLN